jgi:hypothetical protein
MEAALTIDILFYAGLRRELAQRRRYVMAARLDPRFFFRARRGELMLVPEGRYGAGLPIAGIDTVEHRADTHGELLACVTDHGPIELGRFDSKGQARAWQRALERVLAWSRHTAVLLLVVALASAAAACRPT